VTTGVAPWAALAVRIATHGLPPGDVRLRYRAELVAELYGQSLLDQTRYALGALASGRALRRAVLHPDPTEVVRTPWTCRLGLRHRWHVVSAEDGSSRWRECVHCGRVLETHSPPHGGGGGGPCI
jgi:hypothetical protein